MTRRRVLLISAAFSIPVVMLLVQVTVNLTTDTRTTARELEGTIYQRSLVRLLDSLSAHRVAAIATKQHILVPASAAQASASVDTAIEELGAVQASLGPRLQVTPDGLLARHHEHASVDTIGSEWVTLKQDLAGLSASATAERHAHLAGDVRTLARHVGAASNLSRDPGLGSDDMTDLVLVAVPQTIDRLAVIGEFALLHAGEPLSAGDRASIAVFAALLEESDRDRVAATVGNVLSDAADVPGVSPTLAPSLTLAAQAYIRAVDAVISVLRVADSESDGRASLARAGAAATEARRVALALWTTSADELDRMLEARIRAVRVAQLRPLVLALAVWAGALAVVFVMSRSESHEPAGEVMTEARIPRAQTGWSPPPLERDADPVRRTVSPPVPLVERRRPGRPFTRPDQSTRVEKSSQP